jgi:hypothetical protein
MAAQPQKLSIAEESAKKAQETADAVKAAAHESAKKAKETYDLVIPAKIDWSCNVVL